MADEHAATVFNSPPKKRRQKHLSIEEKTTVLNIYKTYERDFPNRKKVENVQFAAEAAGIGVSSVYRILSEYKENNEVLPPRAYHRPRAILENVDNETKSAIRRKVHSFFLKNEPPTVLKMLTAIEEDESIPNLKKTTLKKLLHELGFRFNKRNRNSMLKKKPEIIAWRRRYLREIKKHREAGKKIYYLDETWINAGHTVTKVWTDTTVTTARQAFIQGLSTGLKHPTGKGKRFIILHIGSDDGFVENRLLLFESKKTGDYHEDMDSKVFEKWFEEVLPQLEEGCVIVMDNASYHSRKIDKVPNSTTRKADIQSWLTSKDIAFEEDMVRVELLQLVAANKGETHYALDKMATDTNRTILRLPPYHYELNPIELIWAQTKGEVSRKNTTFKLADVKILFSQSISNVTAENWRNAFGHVIKIEKKMWQLDALMDIEVQPLLINLGEDSDTSSSSESD